MKVSFEGAFVIEEVTEEASGLQTEITASFYGYVGSEPTTITVRYTLEDVSYYDVTYTLVGDNSSAYTFVVTDIVVE